MTPRPDVHAAALLEACRRGDRSALEQVFLEEAPHLRRLLRAALGAATDEDDVLQSTFVAAIPAFARFRGESTVRTWLTRIALRIAREQLGRQRVRADQDLVDRSELAPGQAPDPTGQLEARRELRRLNQLLGELEPRQRLAFVLHVLEGHSLAEVAELTGSPAVLIKARVFRARRWLLQRSATGFRPTAGRWAGLASLAGLLALLATGGCEPRHFDLVSDPPRDGGPADRGTPDRDPIDSDLIQPRPDGPDATPPVSCGEESCSIGEVCRPEGCRCPSEVREAAPIRPDILLVVNRSGSMNANLGGQTKWEQVQGAVDRMLLSLPLPFGLLTFPEAELSGNGNGCPSGGGCGRGRVRVSPGEASGDAIRAELASTRLCGSQSADVEALLDLAREGRLPEEGLPSHVVLVTDGHGGGCRDPLPGIAALRALDPPVRTLVVGFSRAVNEARLAELAAAGGLARPGAVPYYDAAYPDEIVARLEGLITSGLACRQTVAPALQSAPAVYLDQEPVDPALYQVQEGVLQVIGPACAALASGEVRQLVVTTGCRPWLLGPKSEARSCTPDQGLCLSAETLCCEPGSRCVIRTDGAPMSCTPGG